MKYYYFSSSAANPQGKYRSGCTCQWKAATKMKLKKIKSRSFLGAFAKLRKATINFVMSVSPFSARNSTPTRRILMKFDI